MRVEALKPDATLGLEAVRRAVALEAVEKDLVVTFALAKAAGLAAARAMTGRAEEAMMSQELSGRAIPPGKKPAEAGFSTRKSNTPVEGIIGGNVGG